MRNIFTFILCSVLVAGTQFSSNAQSNPAQEKLEKIHALLKKNKIEQAEKKLVDLLDEYPHYGEGWDLMGDFEHYHYKESKKTAGLFGNITVTTKDEDGNEIPVEDDTLATKFMDLLQKMDPSKIAFSKYLYTVRKATLFSNTAYRSSVAIRNQFRVPKVDTMVSTKALKYYNKAEEEFAAKNYNKAAKQYKRALEYQPDFYKAQLYLADAYYYLKYYTEAIKYFKICAEKYPDLIEPRKYLIDSYGKEGLYDLALNEAIESMLVYPDLSNNAKLEDLVFVTEKKLAVEWEPRPIFPNVIDVGDEDSGINTYANPDTVVPPLWESYVNALDKIEKYCDKKGVVITPNNLSDAKYLEVYSWEEMLENAPEDKFTQARKMQALGYLDCFVLVTCFHDDFYDQYRHFVVNNRDKVLDYYKDIVITSN